jgi:thiamine biosynthesis protein ThiI
LESIAVVRYSEIALKGKNRGAFEKQLVENIRAALPEGRVSRRRGRIIVNLERKMCDHAQMKLSKVFGIQNYSFARVTDYDIENISETSIITARELLSSGSSTFKVSTKREYKKFPVKSMELSAVIGERILEALPQLRVNVRNPDFVIGIEVRNDGVYVFPGKTPGPGGLPTGISGKGALLLSGGIDSPVAGCLAMKRGITLIAVHFSSPPYTGTRSLDKVRKLAGILASYSDRKEMELFNVSFTECQLAIKKCAPDKLRLLIQRRLMMRIASSLAESEGAELLVTGESVGQVASQTIRNLSVIDQSSSLLVIRPLVCFDKLETIEYAKKYNTYDTSILPYEDSCTVFSPLEPSTGASKELIRRAEEGLNIGELLDNALREVSKELIPESEV